MLDQCLEGTEEAPVDVKELAAGGLEPCTKRDIPVLPALPASGTVVLAARLAAIGASPLYGVGPHRTLQVVSPTPGGRT